MINSCHTKISYKSFASFEHMVVKLPCAHDKMLLLISIYRLLYVPVSKFHDEFAELLEMSTVIHDLCLITGDINIHFESDETSSVCFHEFMELFYLKQHIVDPTHTMEHNIDVVMTRNNNTIVDKITITRYNLSRHYD